MLAAWPGSAQEIPVPTSLSPEPRVRAAIEGARDGVTRDRQNAEAWGKYGMVLEAHRHLGEATVAYRRAQQLDRDEFRWSYYLGCLLEYTDPREASVQLRRAVELDPGYAPARIRLGQVLETLGEQDEAARHFERAVLLSPGNPLGFFGVGRLALQRGDVDRAVESLERADALEPPIKAVVATLARAYQRAGRTDLAKATAQRARELPRMTHHQDPVRAEVRSLAADLESYLERSRTYREVGQLDAALRELEQLVEIDDTQARAYLLMADVKDRQNDQAGALDAARRALELDPQLDGARPILAGALLKLRRFDEAEIEARRVVASDADNFHMLLVLAVVAAEARPGGRADHPSRSGLRRAHQRPRAAWPAGESRRERGGGVRRRRSASRGRTLRRALAPARWRGRRAGQRARRLPATDRSAAPLTNSRNRPSVSRVRVRVVW